jgi:hypothetical protein
MVSLSNHEVTLVCKVSPTATETQPRRLRLTGINLRTIRHK